jgi:putative tricarboxylic transport membrane protein
MFGPPEYTALIILGLTLVIYLGTHSIIKALLMGVLGMALGTVGLDPLYGIARFTFGSQTLMGGMNIAVLAMGIFGIGEILYMAEGGEARASRDAVKCPSRLRELLPDRKEFKISAMPIARGTVLGFFLGILPGGGAVIASFISYALEKKISRTPERFGSGAIEGVAGPESANNSAVPGCFIPLLTLGIPSNVVMALLVGAFMIHGVIPGPLIMEQNPDLFWGIITSMYIGNIILIILNLPLIKFFVRIMEIPFALLSPLIILICAIGAYSMNNNPIDVVFMMVFGGVGYLIKKFDFEPAPLMLAFVLGPMLEQSLSQTITISGGNLLILFARPISCVLMGVTFLMILSPIVMTFFRDHRLISILEQAKKSPSEKD